MAHDPRNLTDEMNDFLKDRHLASLTILRPDGTPHVTPVGFTWDPDTATARIITWSGAKKVRLLAAAGGGPAALCQVDGGRWATLEGHATVTADPEQCTDAVARYGERYGPAKDRGTDRRAIIIAVDSVLGRA
ncbi:MAG: pyridoxamine 5'-phosphate oxidase family protein [Acidimicrobiia bacterium]|nr:pyridoxamine 5'-phosphate oxidase family protein [Acidimicrobiia bacterium]MCY4433752.1 pyridoxamine 5'-phosphate oxidase family protein [bacterium]